MPLRRRAKLVDAVLPMLPPLTGKRHLKNWRRRQRLPEQAAADRSPPQTCCGLLFDAGNRKAPNDVCTSSVVVRRGGKLRELKLEPEAREPRILPVRPWS
jgi:hypothetical protein